MAFLVFIGLACRQRDVEIDDSREIKHTLEVVGADFGPFPLCLLLHSCLPSLREISNNRSLDNLDCISGPVSSDFPRWDEEDFTQGCNTLGKSSCTTQVSVCACSASHFLNPGQCV